MAAHRASVLAFSITRMSITSISFRSGLALVALVIAALTVRRFLRRHIISGVALGVVTLALVAANVGAAINAHYDYLPSVQALSGSYRGEDQASWSVARTARIERLRALHPLPATLPVRSSGVRVTGGVEAARPAAPVLRAPAAHGLLVQVPIPGVVSGYRARPAEIYLPPAWVSDPSLRLPVLFLLHGSPGSPVDWTRSARADQVSDRWAARHRGVAPILVMPDINGSWWGDSECTDGTVGNADTYVSVDVANWVAGHLRPTVDHRRWGVGGLSEGGTCAVSLALRHPNVFRTFLDYSGEAHISHRGGALSLFPGTLRQRRLQLAAYEPIGLVRRVVDPQQLSGWLEVGANDHRTATEMRRLMVDMEHRGLVVRFEVRPGFAHNFRFWRASFVDSYGWMANRLGGGRSHSLLVHGVPSRRGALSSPKRGIDTPERLPSGAQPVEVVDRSSRPPR